jgi:hypothetical protein
LADISVIQGGRERSKLKSREETKEPQGLVET